MNLASVSTSQIFRRYVIPQMIGLVLNSIYFIVDGVFIGKRLGTGALAAAGVAVPVVEITISLAMLISVGTGVSISQAMGRGDKESARRTFNVSVRFALAFSALLALAGALFAPALARAMGADDLILADTVTYLRYFLGFSPFLVFSFALSTFARNDGKPALAMYALAIGSFSNVVLDYLFMYPLNMGIAGAALATGLGPVFSVLLLLPHFIKGKGSLRFAPCKGSPREVGALLVQGLPAFVSEFSIGFVTLLYNLAVVKNGLGNDGLASYMVIGYAALVSLTAFLGAGEGIQPVVGYFSGAGMHQRTRSLFRSCLAFGAILGTALYLLLFVGGGSFYGIFLGGGSALVEETCRRSQLYFLSLPLAAVNILTVSYLQSSGRTAPSLTVSLCRVTLPLIAFLLILPFFFGEAGLWLAVTGAELVTLGISIFFLARRKEPRLPSQKAAVLR